jgi:hypothetical protein
MNTTRPMTKSPRAVAREKLRLSQDALPADRRMTPDELQGCLHLLG